jgi:hypothetical protein
MYGGPIHAPINALVVGIEQYAQSGWDVAEPAANASGAAGLETVPAMHAAAAGEPQGPTP